MKKLSVFCSIGALILIFSASIAGAADVALLSRGADATINGGYFIVFTEAMQTTVSSGTGVIDPFLTIQRRPYEEGFNSDAFPLVLDTTRNMWNHSIQISDLVVYSDRPSDYEFLLDINEPAGRFSDITQHELEVYIVPEAVGGSLATYAALTAAGTKIYDLDLGADGESSIQWDYDLWQGSGQNIDSGFYLPISLFSSYNAGDYVYLYAAFGRAGGEGYGSQDGFEEYVLREGGVPTVPEPSTLLLLGSGLIGLSILGRKRRA